VIRRLLARPLDWRFRAVIARLDALSERTGRLDGRLEDLERRLHSVHAASEMASEPVGSLPPTAVRAAGRPPRMNTDFLGPDHDSPVQSRSGLPKRSYVICSNPRTGSWLLCRALAQAGLGMPLEYFNPRSRKNLSERWGCGAELHCYVQELHARRTSTDGMFGAKLHWDQLSLVRAEAEAGLYDPMVYETSQELLERLFPNPQFIRIVRRDVDRQAVSYWKALYSNVWLVRPDEEKASLEQEAPYSFEWLEECRRALQNGELGWERLIRARGEEALVITYEDLADAYEETVRRVADFISPGIELAIPAPKSSRMSDERSLELLERYRAERAERADRAARELDHAAPQPSGPAPDGRA
jgi:trehalose 2-sulfotransferase